MPDSPALAVMQAVLFVALLCAASVFDLRRRIIPDSLNLAIAVISLLCFSPVNLWGIAVALPFLLAAVFCGGMGGGDIKLMAACGLVLGLPKGLLAAAVGLCLLLLYVAAHQICCKVQWAKRIPCAAQKAFPLAPFLSAGCLLAYFMKSGGLS